MNAARGEIVPYAKMSPFQISYSDRWPHDHRVIKQHNLGPNEVDDEVKTLSSSSKCLSEV